MFGSNVETDRVVNQSFFEAFATSFCQLLVESCGYSQILQRKTLNVSARVMVSRGLNCLFFAEMSHAIRAFSIVSHPEDELLTSE